MFAPERHPRHIFSRPCFYKSPKGKYTPSLPTLLLCVNKHRHSLCRAGSRAPSICACFPCYLQEVSIIHVHEHIPVPVFPKEHCFTNTKERNQGKPASLKLTRWCSIHWQQKIARKSENLNKTNNRKVEKVL